MRMYRLLTVILIILMTLPGPASSQQVLVTVPPGASNLSTQSVGSAGVSTSATLTGATGQKILVYRVDGSCSPAGAVQVQIQDGSTTIWTTASVTFPTLGFSGAPLTGTAGNSMTVTLTACPLSGVGTLNVQAYRF